MSTEAALMLIAVALYLYDATLLLARNEAVVFRGWGGRWYTGFGAHRWLLDGKEPYLPNPWLPHRGLWRLTWQWNDQPAPSRPATAQHTVTAPHELAYLAAPLYLSALGLFVLLPLGLFSRLGLPMAALAIAVVYLANIVNLCVLFALRHRLHLPPKSFARIAFECLACPPFALNLVRKVCAARRVDEDLMAAATRLLPPERLTMTHCEGLLRLDEQIDFEPDGSARMALLQHARARFLPVVEEAV